MGSTTGIILLAAGASARMGTPKQLLPFRGSSLLRHLAEQAMQAACGPVLLVTGAYEDEIKKEVKDLPIDIITNHSWKEGMGSSIRSGILALQQSYAEAIAAMIMVTDQPYVTAPLIRTLLSAHETSGKPIAACRYDEGFGPPVLFSARYFPALMQLQGNTGAKSIVKQHADEVAWIDFSAGATDIDTPNDYRELLNSRNHDN